MSYSARTPSPFFELLDEGPHALLEPPSPAYTNVTVRRAFIVWMHCGQQNKFKDVCNYYHYLETLEDKLPAERRAASRHHEFDMFCNPPPTSSYLQQTFPKLYSQKNFVQHYIRKVEAIRNDACVFKLEGFNDIKHQKGVTTKEIVETSKMIKKFCKSHLKPLRKFLAEFKEYARKCELKNTVNNVAFYIKRKLIEEELQMVANYPRTFSFLSLNSDEALSNIESVKVKDTLSPKKNLTSENRSNDFTKEHWNDISINCTEMNKLRN